ncbi:MAG: PaaI family thioesterase [bacterium]
MADDLHKHCFACSSTVQSGLRLKYRLNNNTITGKCIISKRYQGYDDIVHGGIIATILDSSMVHLFYLRDGLKLKTAKLNIWFRKQIPINKRFIVTARVDDSARHYYKAMSQIIINNIIFAEAEGYFRK